MTSTQLSNIPYFVLLTLTPTAVKGEKVNQVKHLPVMSDFGLLIQEQL